MRLAIFLYFLVQRSTHAMLFPTDTHQQEKPSLPPPPPGPPPPPNQPTSDTPQSDSGRSFSSSSSSSIMGTPFDLGAQRFEYPFPPAQGSPTDPFLPLSSSHSHSHAQLPPWPIHISKSFPLTQPPLGKAKAHPKLRSASVREPPVPPGLVKRRSRIAGVTHQSSSEDPSDKSDASDEIARARRSTRFLLGLTEGKPLQLVDFTRSEIVPLKQAASLPTGSFDRPGVEGPAVLPMKDATSAERMPRPPVVSASAYNA
ncbi:hypothetical protein JVT61DRAFT_6665 [Boletus reticuloceps]|uniref:Uncharacterized protein n=1 Tax=Boletus reticuloceps TaxID=495285 RepID=A0A8I2YLI6_9AGAM|nr:hypothetical protein JVT61DRAFT_6665 [Boletus reticuloceps]